MEAGSTNIIVERKHGVILLGGHLGSSSIGACLIACGFDTNASKVATIVLAAFFLVIFWWGRGDLVYVCCSLVSLLVKRGSYNH